MNDHGAPPREGWASVVPELYVDDVDTSLRFWCDIVGFTVAYRRPEEGFSYLERHDGPQIMLCARHAGWEVGQMQRPYGRGVLLQVFITDVDAVLSRVTAAGITLFEGPREVWRRWGTVMGGKREIMVQDPDGYLILLGQDIGTRGL